MAEVKKFYDVQGSAIKWRNFEGKAGKFNAEGDRNFCLLIDPDSADVLQSEVILSVNSAAGHPDLTTQFLDRDISLPAFFV